MNKYYALGMVSVISGLFMGSSVVSAADSNSLSGSGAPLYPNQTENGFANPFVSPPLAPLVNAWQAVWGNVNPFYRYPGPFSDLIQGPAQVFVWKGKSYSGHWYKIKSNGSIGGPVHTPIKWDFWMDDCFLMPPAALPSSNSAPGTPVAP
jgi:hypothetical protein